MFGVKPLKILICGDRNYTNYDSILYSITKISLKNKLSSVIEGGAKGADRLGRQAAQAIGVPEIITFKADWEKYGKAAGPIRNRQMIKEGSPNLVLAFHSNISNSKGTKDMIFAANQAGIPIFLYP